MCAWRHDETGVEGDAAETRVGADQCFPLSKKSRQVWGSKRNMQLNSSDLHLTVGDRQPQPI